MIEYCYTFTYPPGQTPKEIFKSLDWCERRFDLNEWRYDCYLALGKLDFIFSNEEDLVEFKLSCL